MALTRAVAARLVLALVVLLVLVAPAAAAALPPTWLVVFWTWDPANVSGTASDANSCTDVTKPCRTFRRILDRLGTDAPRYVNGIAVTFHALSTAPDGSDPVHFHPYLDATSVVNFNEVLPTPCTATLTTTAHKNIAAGTLPSETAAACLTTVGQLIVNTDRGNSTAMTSRQIAGNHFDITQPYDTTNFLEVNTWADGDHVSVYTLNGLVISDLGSETGSGGFLGVTNLVVLNLGGSDLLRLATNTGFTQFTNTRIDTGIANGAPAVFADEFMSSVLNGPAGFYAVQSPGFTAASVTNGNLSANGDQGFAGDDSEFFGGGAIFRIDGTFGWGSNFVSVITLALDHGNIQIQQNGNFDVTAGAHIWGNGTPDGAALLGTSLRGAVEVSGTTATLALNLTPANAFAISGVATACNSDSANPATVRCGIALTPANLDGVLPGGFAGRAFVPGIGSFLVGFF